MRCPFALLPQSIFLRTITAVNLWIIMAHASNGQGFVGGEGNFCGRCDVVQRGLDGHDTASFHVVMPRQFPHQWGDEHLVMPRQRPLPVATLDVDPMRADVRIMPLFRLLAQDNVGSRGFAALPDSG